MAQDIGEFALCVANLALRIRRARDAEIGLVLDADEVKTLIDILNLIKNP